MSLFFLFHVASGLWRCEGIFDAQRSGLVERLLLLYMFFSFCALSKTTYSSLLKSYRQRKSHRKDAIFLTMQSHRLRRLLQKLV